MNILYYLSIILLAGIIGGKLVTFIKLPRVTGYLIAGILIGPSVLDLIPKNVSPKLNIITDVALAFIAYSIGSAFDLTNLKAVGKKVITITVFESLGAVVIINFIMIFVFKMPIAFSIVLAAISAATAPAATLMVIKQYDAKGPLVNTLLPVVALDDAVGIIVFGVSSSIARSLVNPNTTLSLNSMLVAPLKEIVFSLLIGFAIGFILSLVSKKAEGEDQLLVMIIVSLFLTMEFTQAIDASPLLACMMVGATVINVAPRGEKVLSLADRFTPPFFMAFFTIAVVQLDLRILKDVGLIGIVYLFCRALGKIIGAFIGAKITHSPKVVQKYLGLTLVPQAGVAIGLALVAESILPIMGVKIKTIILSSAVIYELIGPLLTKIALTKAGEIKIAPVKKTKITETKAI